MSPLSIFTHRLRASRHRQKVRSLLDLDDHILADVGLLRTDVYAALARPYFADPSKALKDVCCRWRTFANRFHPSMEAVPCC